MSPRKKVENDLYISLLGFLLKKPGYAYDLYRYISKETVFFQIWYLKQSKFYALLDRLYSEGYLSRELLPGDQYPDRKLLSITNEGIKRINEFASSPVRRGREMRQEFLAKLYICRNFLQPLEGELIENQIQHCKKMIEEQDLLVKSEKDEFLKLMIEYRRNQIQAMIDWLASIL